MAFPFAKGERVIVVRDNGRTGIVGFKGTVDMIADLGVVVILDHDPAREFRMTMEGGFEKQHPNVPVRRFFLLNDIEKLREPSSD